MDFSSSPTASHSRKLPLSFLHREITPESMRADKAEMAIWTDSADMPPVTATYMSQFSGVLDQLQAESAGMDEAFYDGDDPDEDDKGSVLQGRFGQLNVVRQMLGGLLERSCVVTAAADPAAGGDPEDGYYYILDTEAISELQQFRVEKFLLDYQNFMSQERLDELRSRLRFQGEDWDQRRLVWETGVRLFLDDETSRPVDDDEEEDPEGSDPEDSDDDDDVECFTDDGLSTTATTTTTITTSGTSERSVCSELSSLAEPGEATAFYTDLARLSHELAVNFYQLVRTIRTHSERTRLQHSSVEFLIARRDWAGLALKLTRDRADIASLRYVQDVCPPGGVVGGLPGPGFHEILDEAMLALFENVQRREPELGGSYLLAPFTVTQETWEVSLDLQADEERVMREERGDGDDEDPDEYFEMVQRGWWLASG